MSRSVSLYGVRGCGKSTLCRAAVDGDVAARDALGIPLGATVAMVETEGASEEECAAADARLSQGHDVVLHDGTIGTYRGTGELVALGISHADIAARADSPAWGKRDPYDRAQFTELSRHVAQGCGSVVGATARRLWWHGGQWKNVVHAALDRAAELAPWYQGFTLAGVPVAPPQSVNGEERWQSVKPHLGKLDGARILEVGSNAGYNSIRMAEAGASVVAYEPSARHRAQFQLVAEMGEFPQSTLGRIDLRPEPAQTVPLGDGFDVTLLGSVHYHINRSGTAPYREPRRNYGLPLLRAPLAVVLEDVRAAAKRIVIQTNTDHLLRAEEPYPEASPVDLGGILAAVGFTNIECHAFGHNPILTATS